MLANFILVALGGALGSAARYGLNLTLLGKGSPAVANLPWGTLAANVLGCFLIGLFTEWAGSKLGMNAQTKLFLTTGFCGGFTTLSTLMLELTSFLRDRDWGWALVYLVASLVLPFVALWLGLGLVKLISQE